MELRIKFNSYYNSLINDIDYYEHSEDKKLFSSTIKSLKKKLKTAKRHEGNCHTVVLNTYRVTFK